MKSMEDLKNKLCDELMDIAEQGEITSGSLEIIDKLTHSIKSIYTIMAMEEAGYSNDRGYSRYNGGYRDDWYDHRSYSRGHGNSRRDFQGRYGNRMMDEG